MPKSNPLAESTTWSKKIIKNFLGQLPFTAELYWLFRQKGEAIKTRFSLKQLQNHMPEMVAQARAVREKRGASSDSRHIFIFSNLHLWMEHTALMGISLAALGNRVSYGYLPYADWSNPINRFDLRRQNVYAQRILENAGDMLNVIPFLTTRGALRLPDPLREAVQQISAYDTQYTQQIEDIDTKSELYRLRLERNTQAAQVAYSVLQSIKPDVVIIPNGTILEMGTVYRVARHLGIPTVTYEFGDQRQRIWLAQNAEVMRQETDALWKATQNTPLTEAQMERLGALFTARQRGAMWENFARLWQSTPTQGGDQARADLGLDERPVVLLATNVLGDSLTLGRQVFSRSMAEWISRTVQYFAGRPDAQLIIRVHPGEVLTHGLSMVDVVREVLPRLPEHIRLIGPKEKINTYDLVSVADVGLVYTTTVGMEMAMNGVPVIVAGQTHYRGRGFTQDPDSWVSYYKILGQILENPAIHRLSRAQIENAWHYAYRFFFDFPRPFPWHLVRCWEDYKNRPLETVFAPETWEEYRPTFEYLTGKPLDWSKIQ